MTLVFVFTAISPPAFVGLANSRGMEDIIRELISLTFSWSIVRFASFWMDRSDDRSIFKDFGTFFKIPIQWDTITPICLGLILGIRRYFL